MGRPSSENPGNRAGGVRGICRRWGRAGAALAFVFGLPLLIAGGALGEEPSRASKEQLKLGRELFLREWEPNDPRCHGGDGLGPVYNETSCVACHGEGGPGGAGPAGMNVEVISALGMGLGVNGGGRNDAKIGSTFGGDLSLTIPGAAKAVSIESGGVNLHYSMDSTSFGRDLPFTLPDAAKLMSIKEGAMNLHFSKDRALGWFRNGFVLSGNGTTLRTQEFDVRFDLANASGVLELSCAEGSLKAGSITLKPDDDALRTIHPGLVETPSVVLHHYGVDPGYPKWRSRLRAQIPAPRSKSTQGLAIPGGRIVASERNSPPLFGLGLIDALPDEVLVATAEQEPAQVRGRVNRMKSGRIGRFGWKAQTTSLREFVLGACSNELGLEAPGHSQATSPLAPEVRAKSLDLTQEECDALVAYVQALPAPVRLESPHPEAVEAGRTLFESIGCADCHRPSLGNIEGIYSDLLMHDMGPDLISVTMNIYYGGTQVVDLPTSSSLADGSEWRTPPLWGYRDSGPYLHDGRARDLHEAVRFHKGQASGSAARFAGLSPARQSEIEQFLNALAAPPEAEAERDDHPGVRRSVLGPPSSSPPSRTPAASARTGPRARAHEEGIAASRLKMAQSLEKMDNPQGALIFYREIVRDEPDSAAARTAAARIEALAAGDEGRKD
jgi:CxxC motif-containing protein (DUF1111 family)